MGKWAGGHSFARQHGCRNINVQRFSKLWTAITLDFIDVSTWTSRDTLKWGYLHFVKILVRKVFCLNFWWRHCKPRISFYRIRGLTALIWAPGFMTDNMVNSWKHQEKTAMICIHCEISFRYWIWINMEKPRKESNLSKWRLTLEIESW